MFQPINQLFNRQLSISVEIDLGEDLSQQNNLVLRNPGSDQAQRCSLQLHRVHVVLHVCEDIGVHLDVRKFLVLLLLDPWVIISFFSR
jgi:hypothetical protein